MMHVEFIQQMNRLVTFKKPTDELTDAYWKAFENWDATKFAYCVTRILQEEDRFPKVPTFQKYYMETQSRPELGGTKDDGWRVFECRECNSSFTVHRDVLENDRMTVWCPGNGISRCHRSWESGFLSAKLAEAKVKGVNFGELA